MPRLGVNVDHVATLRQARGEGIPDLLEAARAAVRGGADGITAHLREDRRHIQDADIWRLKAELTVPLNLEMAATPEIISLAEQVRPDWVCLVPEKRQELTTEGGLDVERESIKIGEAIRRLKDKGVRTSLFIEPSQGAIQKAKDLGADAVELHTGVYAKLAREKSDDLSKELDRIRIAAQNGTAVGLLMNAGHGIDTANIAKLNGIHRFNEFNIGFALVARAVFIGLEAAVKEMKGMMK